MLCSELFRAEQLFPGLLELEFYKWLSLTIFYKMVKYSVTFYGTLPCPPSEKAVYSEEVALNNIV